MLEQPWLHGYSLSYFFNVMFKNSPNKMFFKNSSNAIIQRAKFSFIYMHIYICQVFSTGGSLAPGGHLMLGDIFGYYNWSGAAGFQWVEARHTAKHSPMNGIVPTTKNDLAPNLTSAEIGKLQHTYASEYLNTYIYVQWIYIHSY